MIKLPPLIPLWLKTAIKRFLEEVGVLNKAYDSDLDGVIEFAKNADTVDGEHANAFEHIANKGVANGYCELDSAALVPAGRIPKVGSYETIFEDNTIHTTTSTTWVTFHELINADYNYRIGIHRIRVEYRTTGVATAYILVYYRYWVGDDIFINTQTNSTTSTTTVTTDFYSQYCEPDIYYGSSTGYTFKLQFRTSDSTVPAEVSYERVRVIWGKLVMHS